MAEALLRAVSEALGVEASSLAPLTGGDINEAYLVSLKDGERVFVKTHRRAPPGMFGAEARGLDWLRVPGGLKVPEVLAVSDQRPAYLILEYLAPASAVRDFDERLGEGLSAMHHGDVVGFGLDHDNYIGSLPQKNEPCATWAEFFWQRRLQPQVERAVDDGRAPGDWHRRFDKLRVKLPALVPEERPHRLHGDLWGGNLHRDSRGQPALIDPAVYAGHREVDLAMMRLFGGFSPRVFAAYEAATPLAPGADERVALYQLYPLLVHVNLFGGGYVGSVERALSQYV